MDASQARRAMPLLATWLEGFPAKLDLREFPHLATEHLRERHASRYFGEICPGLVGAPGAIDDLDLPLRCSNALHRQGVHALADVAKLRIDGFADTRQVGEGTVRALILAVVRWAISVESAGIEVEQAHHALELPWSEPAEAAAIERDRKTARAARLALAWLRPEWWDDGAPEVVREALATLAREQRAMEVDLQDVVDDWFGKLEERKLEIFLRRSRPDAPTLAELGLEYGLTRERVRQLHVKCLESLRKFCDQEPGFLLRRQLCDLREQGPVIPLRVIYDKWPDLGREVRPGTRVLDVLVACDGTGEWYDDWLCWIPVDQLKANLRESLARVLRGPALHPADARAALDALGLQFLSLEEVLEKLGWWRAGDVYLPQAVSLQDQALVLLDAHGSPMHDEDIQAGLWRPGSINSLRNQLPTDDRFVRTGPGEWGLSVWGLDEYDGILAEIEKAVAQGVGRVRLEDVVEDLVRRFGVSASSVRAYAARPIFKRRDGYIQLNEAPEPPKRRVAQPASTRRMFQDSTGTWWLRVDITESVLQGFSPAITVGASVSLGVQPGEAKDFRIRGTDITVNFRGMQPSVGSLGRLARELRARAGDHLFLAPGRQPDELRCRRIGHPTDGNPYLTLAALTGTVPTDNVAGATAQLSSALAVLDGLSIRDLQEHLVRRGDDDVAAVLGSLAPTHRPVTSGAQQPTASDAEDFLSAIGWDA